MSRSVARSLCDSWATCSLSVTPADKHSLRYIVTHQGASLQPPYQIRHFIKYYIQSPQCDNATALMEFALSKSSCFFIARQHTDARYWYSNSVRLSVRPSVRLSVTLRYQMKTAWHIVTVFAIRSTNHSSFTGITHFYKSPTGSPPAGAPNTGWV